MIKADLVKKISKATDIPSVDVNDVLDGLFKLVKDTMKDGENIYVRGFGSFMVVKKAQKTGRNLLLGTPHIIPEHYKPEFKPCKEFIENVRNNVK